MAPIIFRFPRRILPNNKKAACHILWFKLNFTNNEQKRQHVIDFMQELFNQNQSSSEDIKDVLHINCYINEGHFRIQWRISHKPCK